ncbi:MAG: DUF2157 domain-containing protein, partial [Planctomycetes bacterium]|nr:DUF2157 domain-containing protein [Planctomycetota bacterium]
MSRRQISDGFRTWLSAEVEVWRGQGIVSDEQSTSILGLYETPREVSDRKRSVASFVLMGLAALMIGLAALLLIGYNWKAMPDAVKLVLVFGAILGTYAGAFYIRFRRGGRLASEVAFFLGCLFYGVGIWQVAQIFHIQVHYPFGVWLWAVGVLAFALCLETPLLHVLFVALMALWAGMEVIGFGDLGPWLFGRWHGVPNGAYSLPLLALPGLVWAYRRNSPVTVGLYALLVAWWVILQPFAWHWEANAIYFIGAVGGLFLLIAQLHREGSRFAIPYRLYGVLLTAGVLVPLSFHDFNEEMLRWMDRHGSHLQGLLAGPVILVLSAAAVALVAFFKRAFAGESASIPDQMMGLIRRQWLPVGVVLLMSALPLVNATLGWAGDKSVLTTLPVTVLANVGMIVLALWLMRLGLQEDRGQPFAAGVVYFLLWSVLRYVDLFAD